MEGGSRAGVVEALGAEVEDGAVEGRQGGESGPVAGVEVGLL